MTIEKEVIEKAKRTDLVALVQAKGIELKKNGKSWFGLCPFHADKNPSLSINPTKNLFKCFGCGAAGDAIRFVKRSNAYRITVLVPPGPPNRPPKSLARERPSRTANCWPA
jgi:hypothetical protein